MRLDPVVCGLLILEALVAENAGLREVFADLEAELIAINSKLTELEKLAGMPAKGRA